MSWKLGLTSLLLLVLIALLGPLSSCGSNTVSTVPLDNFVHASAEAECAWEFRCCTDAELSHNFASYTTQDSCVPYQALALENGLYLIRQAMQEGRLKINQAAANACLAARQARQCTPKLPPSTVPQPSTNDPCAQLFVGTVPVGHECALESTCILSFGNSCFRDDCVGGARCVSVASSGSPTDVADTLISSIRPRVASLEVSTKGVCVAFQAVGQVCNQDLDCDPTVANIYCANQDSKCHILGKEGDPCAYTLDASSNPTSPVLLACQPVDSNGHQLYCDPTSKTCRQLPGAGQSCLNDPIRKIASFNQNTTIECAAGTLCDAVADNMPGVCYLPGKAGDSCGTNPNRICDSASDLFCDTSQSKPVCAPLPTAGKPCTALGSKPCASSAYCDSKTCQPLLAANAPCTANLQCGAGLYCDTAHTTKTCIAQVADYQSCENNDQCLSGTCASIGNNVMQCLPAQICTGR